MGESLLDRYLRRRRVFEAGFFVLLLLGNALANSVVATLELERVGQPFRPWEPLVWEFSSHLALLALLPGVLAFDRRFPLYPGRFLRHLPAHAAATIAFSGLHVAGMLALREAAYRAHGADYDFGDWSTGLFYEYLIDARTYFVILAGFYLYRHVLLRLQGEARMLDPPEDAPPVAAVARPERLLVRKFAKEFLVPVADIEWIESAENYVNLHVRGHVYPLRSTMADIAARLDPVRFARVHRRFIVNLDRVESLEPLDTGDAWLQLRDGPRLPCSRRYRATLKTSIATG